MLTRLSDISKSKVSTVLEDAMTYPKHCVRCRNIGG